MTRQFFKMHGIGNDYIFFDCFEEPVRRPAELSKKLSDRHFSVGGDGIVLILQSGVADAKMRMFNADGSEGNMCGNAIRCVAKYLREKRGILKDEISIETRSGIKTVRAVREGRGRAISFCVDMGSPVLRPARIPALFEGDRVVGAPLIVGETAYKVTCVSMGNPHCVVFCEDPERIDLPTVGPMFERHPAFPERVNTEFVKVAGKNSLKMRVWERGSGETLACGTGACAAAVAAVLNGYAERGTPVAVRLAGGELSIVVTDRTVLMTGPAAFSFTGEAEI